MTDRKTIGAQVAIIVAVAASITTMTACNS